MKILLIVPTHNYKNYPSFLSVTDFPMGFPYITSALEEAGHTVYGLNLNNITGYATAHDMISDLIPDAIRQVNPDMIGTGGLCIDYHFLKDAFKLIRETTKVPVVLGGNIVTNDAEFIFRTLKPDYAIIGEGEEPFVKLANKDILETIPNLWYWKNKKTAKYTYQDFKYKPVDSLPFPDFDAFGIKQMVDNFSHATRVLYRYPKRNPRPFIIVTARGCPFACNFCRQHPEGYRPRSIENIMAEIIKTYHEFKYNILIIQDELFAANNKRMRIFCEQLIANKKIHNMDFTWLMQTHANARLDLETLKLAKKAGLFLFSYGLESASPTVLRSMKKHTKPEQIVEAIRLADEAGVGFAGNLLFGDPAETMDTMQESMKFYFKHGIDPAIFITQVMPYPGSDIFDYCIKNGLIKDKLEYYEHINETIYNMTKMPNHVYEEWNRFLSSVERSYVLFKTKDAHKCKEVKTNIWEVSVNCPFCGQECAYTQYIPDPFGKFIVPLCQHCNKRIRINVPMELKLYDLLL